MSDSNRRVRRVHALSSSATRAEHVNAKIDGIDVHIHFFSFGQNRYRHGRSVNSALSFGRWNALNTMNAAFPLQSADRLGLP